MAGRCVGSGASASMGDHATLLARWAEPGSVGRGFGISTGAVFATRYPYDEVRESSDHESKPYAAKDIERGMCPEVDTSEPDERHDRPRQDPPPASQVRGHDPR